MIGIETIRKMCRYYSLSYDSYKDKLEHACHNKSNVPDGDSWGICDESNCPFMKPESDLVAWLLDKIWDEETWDLNYQAFPELLCRKLVKLGYLKEKDGKYELPKMR